MKDLIKAFQIFSKYGNPDYPTCCEHDVLIICGIDPDIVSTEDLIILEELGFFISDQYGEKHFQSFRFGSA